MIKNVTFLVDEDVFEKYRIALNLTKEEQNDALDKCLRWYITKTFKQASQTYNPNTISNKIENKETSFHGKANHRIPAWAGKPTQYNHKIIRAYFKAIETTGAATIETMELLCSDLNISELYVPTFKTNYSQMKLDGSKSHGKVFEDDGDKVYIWSEVEETLKKYKPFFTN